ncbi:MAG: PEP-CTERM sorting domain-containing protein [Verrucomicrobiales bacterium]
MKPSNSLIAALVLCIVSAAAPAAVITVAGPGGSYLVSDNTLVPPAITAVTTGAPAADASYSEPGVFGGQDAGQPDSWNGDRRWGNGGAATAATWNFIGLSNGVYDVYASWRNATQNNVSSANYTGTDGFATTILDQRVGAAALPGVVLNDGTNDVNFAFLAQVTVADGNFALSVDDSVTGSADGTTFIFADAIAIQGIPEPAVLTLLGLCGFGFLRRRRG